MDACRQPALPPYVGALLRPAAYPHPATDLQFFETHISWVVLAGAFAYKVKKPVDLGFLDFSTLERRTQDCAEEVRLNRRLCPDVYLGVVDLVERDGEYFVGGPGRPIEPAVRMRRLSANGMLPHLLTAGVADAALMGRIARHLAAFHATAATGPGVDEHGSLATIRANWRENFAQLTSFRDHTLSATVGDAIERSVERFMADERVLFERRVAEGRIRDGHGDLHAASICVEGEALHLFDCLEFGARFRCADVAAEVAFLAMDLEHYQRLDLAEAFVDAYVERSGDHELRRLLDFYVCYRAYVRGKVLSLRLTEPGLTASQGRNVIAEARAYFELAADHATGGATP